MIVKGLTRAITKKWVTHMTNADDNEDVHLYHSRGLAHSDISGGLREMSAMALGTKCKKPLFEVVFRPAEQCPEKYLKSGIEQLEQAYPDLKKQPRMIVAHTKAGFTHWHVIYGRCRADGPAVNLPWVKIKAMEISHKLFLERGLEPPKQIADFVNKTRSKTERAPSSDIDHATFRAAERMGVDARDVAALAGAAWKSGNFEGEMMAHGFMVARGDRGFVLVDPSSGRVLALTRILKPAGVDRKAMIAGLRPLESYKTIDQVTKLKVKFNTTANTKAPAVSVPLVNDLLEKKAVLTEVKIKQQRIEKEFERAAQWALKLRAENANTSTFSVIQVENGPRIWADEDRLKAAVDSERRRLKEKHRQEREHLVKPIFDLKREISRFNLKEAARAMFKLAALIFKPPPPVVDPAPVEKPQQSVSMELSGKHVFERMRRDRERRQDRLLGRKSDAPGRDRGDEWQPHTPPPKGPKGPGF